MKRLATILTLRALTVSAFAVGPKIRYRILTWTPSPSAGGEAIWNSVLPVKPVITGITEP